MSNAQALEELPKQFDFIIVGAGSAGCILANKLSASGQNVLLLEAGVEAQNSEASMTPNQANLLWQSEADWGYISEPQKELEDVPGENPVGRRLFFERGKTLGGSSAINFMIWVRGAHEDFDRWEQQYGASGWAHENILEYFKELENADSSEIRNNTAPAAAAVSPNTTFDGSDYRGKSGPIRINTLHPAPPEIQLFRETALNLDFGDNADYNGREHAGVTQTQWSVDPRTGRRMDAFTAFLTPQLRASRPNLRVLSHAFTTRVLFDADKRAVGVEVEVELADGGTDGGTDGGATSAVIPVTFRAAKEVVLCAGAINSPQLLVLSGVGDRADLAELGVPLVAHVPGVGRGLQDHPNCGVGFELKADAKATHGVDLAPIASMGGTGGALLFCQSPAAAARERADGHARGADVQIALGARTLRGPKGAASSHPLGLVPGPAGIAARASIVAGAVAGERGLAAAKAEAAARGEEAVWHPRDDEPETMSLGCILNQVESRGRLRVVSADPHVPARINPDMFDHPDDMQAMVWGVKQCHRLATTAPLADVVERIVSPAASGEDAVDWDDDGSIEAHVRRSAGTTWHYSCTCRMGDTGDGGEGGGGDGTGTGTGTGGGTGGGDGGDPLAVLDARCRVRGVRGLRVADASAMPAVTSGNINAPTMMLAARAADLILEEYRLPRTTLAEMGAPREVAVAEPVPARSKL